VEFLKILIQISASFLFAVFLCIVFSYIYRILIFVAFKVILYKEARYRARIYKGRGYRARIFDKTRHRARRSHVMPLKRRATIIKYFVGVLLYRLLGVREISLGKRARVPDELRWLTRTYFQKKGLVPVDIAHWKPYRKSNIRKMLANDTLLLKNSIGDHLGLVIIKDWNRVVGIDQGYQISRLRSLLVNENVAINGLRFILVSHRGFSESIKGFARKQEIELKSEYEMTYEFPTLREFIRRRRRTLENVREKDEAHETIVDSIDSVQPYQIEALLKCIA